MEKPWETHCVKQWIVIYPVDSAINNLLNVTTKP